jgi:hypothetical protein
VPWPTTGSFWIEQGIEHEGRRVHGDIQYHYTGFHAVSRAVAYDENALAWMNTMI